MLALDAVRAIVQFNADTEADLTARLGELADAGLKLDPRFGKRGAICVNPKAGRYVARGEIADESLPAIQALKSFEIFADLKVLPVARR